MTDATCRYCSHPTARHNEYGCGLKDGHDVYCDCGWDPERQARLVSGFPDKLLELWEEACEIEADLGISPDEFAAWSGATKDLLIGLGMEWDSDSGEGGGYVFVPKEKR